MPHEVDFSKVERIHSVVPSKFPGKSLVTATYFGNDAYQFLCTADDLAALRKEHPFDPEDANVPGSTAKPPRKRKAKPGRKPGRR